MMYYVYHYKFWLIKRILGYLDYLELGILFYIRFFDIFFVLDFD